MATFEKRKGSWRAKVRRRGAPVQTMTFDTKADAEAWARSIETSIDKGQPAPSKEAERTTLKEALERYEREITPGKKGKAQETHRIKQWKKHPLAARMLSHLRGTDFSAYRDERAKAKKSGDTIRLELALVSHLYTVAAKEWGMDSLANPLENVRRPRKPPGRDRRLEDGEEKRLLEAADKSSLSWLRPIIEIAIETAMRQSEILGLKWKDVDLKERLATLKETKSGKPRSIPLTTRAKAVLENLPTSLNGQVFPVTKWSLAHAFRDACATAKIEGLRFHDLRHEGTSRLFEFGLDHMEVSEITGHKTLDMLKRYTHLRAKKLLLKLG